MDRREASEDAIRPQDVMKKERILKDDGRYIIFYDFETDAQTGTRDKRKTNHRGAAEDTEFAETLNKPQRRRGAEVPDNHPEG